MVFATLLLSVLLLYIILDRSLRRDIYQNAHRQALHSIQRLQHHLDRDYEFYGSFNHYRLNERKWRRAKNQAFDFRPPPRSSGVHRQFAKPLAQYREFIDAIVLADAEKKLIAGTDRADERYRWRPIRHDGATVGYLGYVPPKRVLRAMDIDILQQHLKRLWVICLGLLALSSVAAAMISRKVSVPIRDLSRQTHRLAGGDYTVQVPVRSLDEIGDLCRNFNELAIRLEANQLLHKQWVADISHEMRTPVSVLKAQIESMQDGVRPLNAEQLHIIAKKIESLRKLVDDLFELSLSDMGSLSYTKATVNISELLAEACEAYAPRFAQKNLRFNWQNALSANVTVFADAKRLTQLFTNLLENSRRYTNAGGEVILLSQSTNEKVRVILQDSAPAVAPEQLDRIFERLYRAEASRSRETGGAGLGLAICKNIVTAHGGSIWAELSPLGGIKVVVELLKENHDD